MRKGLTAGRTVYSVVVSKPAWPERVEKAAKSAFAGLVGGQIAAASTLAGRCGDLTAVIGLTGAICAQLSLCCSSAAARHIAIRMFGLPAPSEEQIRVGLGELAHRIARKIYNQAADPSCERLLTPPVIVGEVDAECSSTQEGYLVVFEFQGFPVWIRLSF